MGQSSRAIGITAFWPEVPSSIPGVAQGFFSRTVNPPLHVRAVRALDVHVLMPIVACKNPRLLPSKIALPCLMPSGGKASQIPTSPILTIFNRAR
jgi:hypothetical protein